MSLLHNDKLQAVSRKLQAKALGLLLAAFSLSLPGCGFHLRGNLNDTVQLPPTYLAGNAGPLKQEVRHYLAVAQAPVVEDQQDAQLVISLLDEDIRRRVVAVDTRGRAEEYEVIYAASYSATRPGGEVVVAPETLTQQRSYTFNQAEVLAKSQEQDRLVEDMRREVVRRIMLRVQAKLNPVP